MKFIDNNYVNINMHQENWSKENSLPKKFFQNDAKLMRKKENRLIKNADNLNI